MTAPISVNDGWVAGRGEEDATRRRRDDDENNGGGHGRGDGRGDGETTATVSRGAPQWGGSCAGKTTATTTTWRKTLYFQTAAPIARRWQRIVARAKMMKEGAAVETVVETATRRWR